GRSRRRRCRPGRLSAANSSHSADTSDPTHSSNAPPSRQHDVLIRFDGWPAPADRVASTDVEGSPGFRGAYEDRGRKLARRIARGLLRGVLKGVSPNMVTVTGCVLAGVSAVFAFREQFLVAAIVFLLGSALDAMDGAVAKVTGKVSAFGAFLDST